MLVIGFYSIGTPYEQEAALLRASLDKVGMAHRITGFQDRGVGRAPEDVWYLNTAAKAELILDARQTLRGPLLYVDVDAFVHSNCEAYFDDLADKGFDFAAHYFLGPPKGKRWSPMATRAIELLLRFGIDSRRLLSGTLFFGDTTGALALCEAWVVINDAMRKCGLMKGGGQKNLWYITTFMDDLKIHQLPGRFCRVFDKAQFYPPKEPVIIEHTIASRENRDAVRVNHGRQNRIAELQQVVR